MERPRADVAVPAADAVDVPADEPTAGPPQEADADPTPAPSAGAEAVPEPDAAPEPDAEAPEPDAPTPADIAEQEQAQEALWRGEQARAWHERTWLRALVGLAVVTGLGAIIPYPLRITSECTIIPSERAKVRSELPGVLSEILVDEGRVVKQGEVIARLDDRALQAERLKVLAEIDRIEAELAVLRQGHRREEIQQQEAVLASRRNEVEFAAKEADRRGQMARDGVGSRQAEEEASRELEIRRRAVDAAQAALRLLLAGSRPEELAAQEAVLKRARTELAYVDERLAMTLVRAPIDGEILTPRFRERIHEGVEAGGLVCEIANTHRMRAEIVVPEREIDAIALGMPAVVKVESYPTHPFEGKVDFIAPSVEGEARRVRVVVELDNAAGMLKSNMTGYGEIEAGKRSLLHLTTRRAVRWVRVRFLL